MLRPAMVDEIALPPHYEAARALALTAPQPAIVGNVRFGTAGWTDPSLIKSHSFYPRGTGTSRARLEHYARHFRLVEVDATYYALLAPAVVQNWLGWTDERFVFNIKAHASLTGHPVELGRLPADIRERIKPDLLEQGRVPAARLSPEVTDLIAERFYSLVEPLHVHHRLGALLMQFPPWFTATRGNARHLEWLAERWSFPIAVEFRHPSWLDRERRERVLSLVRRLGWAYVIVDEPRSPVGGVPPVVAVTSGDLALLRLHGHNAQGWRPGASVAERFDYLYQPEQLARWVGPVRDVAKEAQHVHVVFNNCVRDYAIVGAKGLASLLVQDASDDEPS